MMKTTIWLVAIPDEACVMERLDLRTLMNRALKIEQRLKKKVDEEAEQRRYQILCDRIEYLGNQISISETIESVSLGTDYLDLLLRIQKQYPEECLSARLLANFCPAHLLEKQIEAFESLTKRAGIGEQKEVRDKTGFYRRAIKSGCHVLELPEFISDEEEAGDLVAGDLHQKFLSLPMNDQITTSNNANAFIALRNQIKAVIAQVEKGIPAAVNVSDIAHNVITEILHEFVYKSGKPMYLPVVYGDGSKARPFPIHCLKPRKDNAIKALSVYPLLNVGMMSGRHHELDDLIKFYFYRNQEISTGKTAAETDETAYRKAKEIFPVIHREGIFRIAFYQTGFQPVVMGFYRALTEELIKREKLPPQLELIPQYYFGDYYENGKTWA